MIRAERRAKMEKGLKEFVASFKDGIRKALSKVMAPNYDIFISYCHKNAPKAEAFLNRFRELGSSLSVFFDRIELKAGEFFY